MTAIEAQERDLGRPADFARDGYAFLPALIEPALTDYFWSYVHTKFASRLLSSGDAQVPHTPAGYGDPAFDGLSEYLRPQVERRSGLALHPTYSYFRLYERDNILKRHRDRPAYEISVTLNIGLAPAEPWPIYVEGNAGAYGARLVPGDALLSRGCDCFHWREAYEGARLVQAFLHYIDQDGPQKGQKFDGHPSLMRPPQRPVTGDQGEDK